MRWEQLFDGLEAMAAADARAELEAEVADRAAVERARVDLVARLAAHRGRELTVIMSGGERVAGRVTVVAADALLMAVAGIETLIPLAAVDAYEGLERRAATRSHVESRRRMTSLLRALADARANVAVRTRDATYVGVVVEVGADHLDLVDAGVSRTLVLASIVAVRAAPGLAL